MFASVVVIGNYRYMFKRPQSHEEVLIWAALGIVALLGLAIFAKSRKV